MLLVNKNKNIYLFSLLFVQTKKYGTGNLSISRSHLLIRGIWLLLPLDHKDMPQVGYYHFEIIQKYLKFFKKDVFLKLILTPPPCFPQVFPQV